MNRFYTLGFGLIVIGSLPRMQSALLSGSAAGRPASSFEPSESAATLASSLLASYGPLLTVLGVFVLGGAILFGLPIFGGGEPLSTEADASVHEPESLQVVLRRVREWLARQKLPDVSRALTQSIAALCEQIAHQLDTRAQADLGPTEASLNQLLSVELSTLVLKYQRVPNVQKLWRSLNMTANDALLQGLNAVEAQLRQVHDDLAAEALRELAVQARYLELSAGREPDIAWEHGLTP